MAESITTRILRRPEVQRRTGLGRTAIYFLMAEGKFPAPIRLTEKSVGWLEAEVAAWIAARVLERDAKARTSAEVKPASAARSNRE
jgi:prophage regulatory protein